jgi:Glyoxalase/Bleomycin resistance protein/Dioxygenase superfamily
MTGGMTSWTFRRLRWALLSTALSGAATGRITGPPFAVDVRRRSMAVPLSLGPVHHIRLTVTDVERSRAFYTELLGFQIAMDAPCRPTTPTTT